MQDVDDTPESFTDSILIDAPTDVPADATPTADDSTALDRDDRMRAYAHGGMRNPIRRLVVQAGGVKHVAFVLQIARAQVNSWIKQRRVPKTEHAVGLALLAGVPLERTCYVSAATWQRIKAARAALDLQDDAAKILDDLVG